MKDRVIRTLSGLMVIASLYTISPSIARADDWGCQVLLCLSNPGGPTQYSECQPPIKQLWSHLAKGRSFPTCSGVGFSASRPRYEPYYCDAGFRLVTRLNERGGNEAGCVSTEPVVTNSNACSNEDSSGGNGHWYYENGKRVCKAYVTARPHVREQPRYVDVSIDGVGTQRVWF